MTSEPNDNASPTVAVFWDYENCEVPASADASTVASGICRIAQEYGEIITFRAYLQVSDFGSPRSTDTLSKLRRCGVSILDCYHDGRKDVADKKILVDMFAHAMDKPASTIVLISGDRDFFHAISVLQLRRYKIVLMSPSTARLGLKTSATSWYEWPRQILQAGEMADREQFGSAHHRSSSADAILNWPPPETDAALMSFPTPPVGVASLPASPARGLLLSAAPPPPLSPQEPIYCYVGCYFAGPRNRTNAPASPHTPSSTSTWATVAARGRQSVSASSDTQVPHINEPTTPSSPGSWRSPRTLASESILSLTNSATKRWQNATPPTTDNNGRVNLSDRFQFPALGNAPNEANSLAASPGLLPAIELSPAGSSQVLASSSLGLQDFSGLDTAVQGSPSIPAVETAANFTQSLECGGPPSQLHPHIVVPKIVMVRGRKPPQKYKLLVRVLEEERVLGRTRVPFSQLGSMLKKQHPSVMQRAGTDRLKEFVSMAEKDHVVIVGHDEGIDPSTGRSKNSGNAWASLHPIFHGMPAEKIAQPSVHDQESIA